MSAIFFLREQKSAIFYRRQKKSFYITSYWNDPTIKKIFYFFFLILPFTAIFVKRFFPYLARPIDAQSARGFRAPRLDILRTHERNLPPEPIFAFEKDLCLPPFSEPDLRACFGIHNIILFSSFHLFI